MKTKNNFVLSADGQVVVDEKAKLTWQQTGSPGEMTYIVAEKYVEGLNAENFAGHSDWRLPTLEEAMPLMEPKQRDGLYIDPVFDRAQRWIWTADKERAGRAWVVGFSFGYCHHFDFDSDFYVRAVRS
jgi:serine/threonine-protein kinase